MITCIFEKGYKASLRHIVTHAIVEDHGKLLLVKRTGDMLETGKWSLPGGFLVENLISFDKFAFDHGESIKLYLEYRLQAFLLPILS